MINLVFILFVKSLDIFFCTRKKHQHIISDLENVSKISSTIYRIYYLKLYIINYWNHSLKFIWFFIIINYNIQNSQILLDRLVLKDFKINIYNNINSWKFEQKLQMTEIFSHKFIKKLTSIIYIFEVWITYRSYLDNDDNFWDDRSNFSDNLTNMLKKLHQKYHDFFNIWNID